MKPAALLAFLLGAVSCSPAARAPRSAPAPTPGRSAPAGASLDVVPSAWHLPAARAREAAGLVGGRIVVAGGLDAAGGTTAGVFSIDPATGRASSASLSTPSHDAASAVLGDALYVFGGGSSATIDLVQRTDGTSSSRAGRLPAPRSDCTGATLGSTAFVVGGYDGNAWSGSVLATEDGVRFRSAGTLRVRVRYAAAVAEGSSIYVFGGTTTGGGDTTAIQRFDHANGSTTIVGHLAEPLSHATAASDGSSILIFGGRVRGTRTAAILRFDPATGAITRAGDLPRALSDEAVVATTSGFFVIGGEAPSPVADVTIVRERRS
jgi:hypothetical protein